MDLDSPFYAEVVECLMLQGLGEQEARTFVTALFLAGYDIVEDLADCIPAWQAWGYR